jgi:hypothetical protein
MKVSLEPLDPGEALAQSRRMTEFFGESRIRGADFTEPERETFSVIKDFDIS